MNIAEYFEEKQDRPIDDLIRELQNNGVPITLAKRPIDKTEIETLIDHILSTNGEGAVHIPA